jgi:hypothetical protein
MDQKVSILKRDIRYNELNFKYQPAHQQNVAAMPLDKPAARTPKEAVGKGGKMISKQF